MKTSELKHPLLDLYVAKALGRVGKIDEKRDCCLIKSPDESWGGCKKYIEYYPSTKWFHGGPIIENMKINIKFLYEDTTSENRFRLYVAWIGDEDDIDSPTAAYGYSVLEAAMLSFVRFKFGEEVEGITSTENEAASAPTQEEQLQLQQMYGEYGYD